MKELGVPLHEQLNFYPSQLTHRQFLAMNAWLDIQFNRPDRSDYYQMQTTLTIARILAKHPNKIKMKDFFIEFNLEGEKVDPKHQKQKAEQSFRNWMGIFGITDEMVEQAKEGPIEIGTKAGEAKPNKAPPKGRKVTGEIELGKKPIRRPG